MERDANYIAVGAFILLITAMAVTFVIWYTDASDGGEYDLYEIYFADSVSGLDRGSTVRYLGVDVGRVRRVSIARNDSTRVKVIAEVDRSTPISAATRASLQFQGLTGLLYVNLKQAPELDPNAQLKQGDQYPIIESLASDFDLVLNSLPELMSRATSLMERVGRVFSDANLKGVSETIANLSAASAGLPETSREVAKLVDELSSTVVELKQAATTLNGMSQDARPEVQQVLARFTSAADNLAKASSRIDEFTQKSQGQLEHFTGQGLFELEQLVRETRAAADEFRDLSRSLRENPSQILYEPPVSGVEIRR
jgi:phospholipid/cholesterol/gamma-HCH transport system substrate-binding protein